MLYSFILKNFLLISFFFLISFFLLAFEVRNFFQSRNGVNVIRVVDLINHKNAILIDVRSYLEFKKIHLFNSINIPFDELEKNLIKLKKIKSRIIIIIHSKNSIALKAVDVLKKNNFSDVFFMENGINFWIESDLPVKRSLNEN